MSDVTATLGSRNLMRMSKRELVRFGLFRRRSFRHYAHLKLEGVALRVRERARDGRVLRAHRVRREREQVARDLRGRGFLEALAHESPRVLEAHPRLPAHVSGRGGERSWNVRDPKMVNSVGGASRAPSRPLSPATLAGARARVLGKQ